MTQRLEKVKTDKVRSPNSNLVTNGPEAQNENKQNSPDKIGRLHTAYLNLIINTKRLKRLE